MYLSNNDIHDREDSASSSPVALYALLALTVIFVFGGFFLIRFIRHQKPSLLPNYSWLRGKGKGAKGRLGIELLPTSIKSNPALIESPRVGVFAGSSNVGKDSLLSRSSSFEILPTFSTNPPPIRSPRNPFKFSKSRSYPHRRSKSLGVPTRHPALTSTFPLSSSSPPTPSPQALLIDFSTSNSSSSSAEISASSNDTKATSSSDLGTHRFSPDAVVGPLIPIPMPVPSPKRPSTSTPTPTWGFDHEDDDNDPLMAAFRRSQPQSSSSPLPTPALLPSSSYPHPQPPTPSTADFPLTPPPPGLTFGRLDLNAAWAIKGKDRDISSPISPSPTDAIELVSITPPSPSPVDARTGELAPAPLFLLPFPATGWNERRNIAPEETVKLVDVEDEEEHLQLVDVERKHEAEGVVDQEEAVYANTHVGVPVAAHAEVAQEEVPMERIVEHDPFMQSPNHWEHWHTEQHAPIYLEDSEGSLSLSSSSPSPSTTSSPQYSPPLGLLHTSPLPLPITHLVEVSRPPSPLDVTGAGSGPSPMVTVVPPSRGTSWSWDAHADEDEDGDGVGDAWGFGTGAEHVMGVEDMRGDGEDLIRFEGSDGARDDSVESDAGDVRVDPGLEEDTRVHAGLNGSVGAGAEQEETWFAEEPTVVWNAVQDVVEGVEDKDTEGYVLGPVFEEEKVQILQPVLEEKLVFEVQNEQPAVINVAKELLGSPISQPRILMHDQHQGEAEDFNVIHEQLPTTTPTPALERLSIPIVTTNDAVVNQRSEKEFPDPDLLPLPLSFPSPPHLLSSQKPSSPPIIVSAPAQTPTPPASPPISPWRSQPLPVSPVQELDREVVLQVDTRSDYSGLTTPRSTPVSPFSLDTPIVIPDVPARTPSSATLIPSMTRPAWSLRAADAPALGIPAPNVNVGMRARSSPDMRTGMRVLGEVVENEKVVEVVKHDYSLGKEMEGGSPLIKLSTSLPGTFPSPKRSADSLPASPLLTSTIALSLSAAAQQGTPGAAITIAAPPPVRRRTPRSPLDIALAMQLRPGLGLGADPAWMVRFLMSMFGWFAILISGRGDFDAYVYAGGVETR